jgi:hypothetical protein
VLSADYAAEATEGVLVIGFEAMAGAVVMYLVRRAGQKAGKAVDQVVDKALDAGMDQLADMVDGVLGGDEDVAALQEQAGAGEVEPFTQQIVQAKIARASAADEGLAARLEGVVEALRERERQLGVGQSTVVRQNAEASGHGRVYQAGRDQIINEK